MTARALVCVILVLSFAPLSAWKNPRQSATLNTPISARTTGSPSRATFWRAVRLHQNNLNRFFIGTEAPDNGFKPADAEGAYRDAAACHCILFDENGKVTKDRAELRVRQELTRPFERWRMVAIPRGVLRGGARPLHGRPGPGSTTSWEPNRTGAQRTRRDTAPTKLPLKRRPTSRIAPRRSSRASSPLSRSVGTRLRRLREPSPYALREAPARVVALRGVMDQRFAELKDEGDQSDSGELEQRLPHADRARTSTWLQLALRSCCGR